MVCIISIVDQGTHEGYPVQNLFCIECAVVLTEFDGFLWIAARHVSDIQDVVGFAPRATGK